jgi:hypothetical protein
MSGWQKLKPNAKQLPVDAGIRVSLSRPRGVDVLRVRVPTHICEEYAIDEGDTFDAYIDGTGLRLRFEYATKGQVVAKKHGSASPTRALTFILSALSFGEDFEAQFVEHEKINGDLCVTLPVKAEARS